MSQSLEGKPSIFSKFRLPSKFSLSVTWMMDNKMILRACYITNRGKVRINNEDCVLINQLLLSEADMQDVQCQLSSEEVQIHALADGMGGHAKGELASRSVLTAFKEKYREIKHTDDIWNIVRLARENLNSLVRSDREKFGLGTTISGLLFKNRRAFVFSCGDSRIYMYSQSRLKRITKDHSLVQELVDSGIITEEEMRFHPQKHILVSSVMGDLRSDPPDLFLKEIEIAEGERFLLCSDGLWESMSKDEMERCLAKEDLGHAGDCLFKQAMARDAPDNISFIVLEVLDLNRQNGLCHQTAR
ncbi:MAG: protein phosphatase 2C domain-containing protein [Nitrospirota bacterium]